MNGAGQDTGVRALNHFSGSLSDKPERLPVTACRQYVAGLAVGIIFVRVPVARARPFDQFKRHTVTFDRQRMYASFR